MKIVCSLSKKISNDQVKFAANNTKAKIIACEHSVERVATFGVVLYRNKWPLHFAECIFVVLSDTKYFVSK